MNKILLAIIILIVVGCNSKPKIYNTSDVEEKEHVVYERATNEEITGILKKYYESGALFRETLYKDGKENGIAKSYYKSSALRVETPYKDGKVNGTIKWYYEDGPLQREIPHKDGKINGIQKFYYESGALQMEFPYKDDKANGIQKFYYRLGALGMEIPHEDDHVNGIQKTYYESGALRSEIKFVNSDAISGTFYNENGTKQRDMTNADFNGLIEWEIHFREENFPSPPL